MDQMLDESNIHEFLTAFADGELDARQNLAVLDYMAAHPEALESMREEQQLRVVAQRVVYANTPAVPDKLRQCVTSMGLQSAAASSDSPALSSSADSLKMPSPSHRLKWISVAAAVLFPLGIIVGGFMPHRTTAPSATVDEVTTISSPTLVTSLTKIHVDCSRFDPRLHVGPLPTTAPFAELAKNIEAEFHRQLPYPDLSSIGYTFVGAGPCRKPLEGTAHLLYRSIKPTVKDTLSIFVQPYSGQVTLQPGKMFLAGGDGPHPTFVWRSDRAVFFLITDDLDTADQARDAIQVAFNG